MMSYICPISLHYFVSKKKHDTTKRHIKKYHKRMHETQKHDSEKRGKE